MRRIYCKLLITTLVLSASGQSSSVNLFYGMDGACAEKTCHDIRQDLEEVLSLDANRKVNIYVVTNESVIEQYQQYLNKGARPQVSVNWLNLNEIIKEQFNYPLQKVFSNVVKVVEHSQYDLSTPLTAEQARLCRLKAFSVFVPYLFDKPVGRFCLRGLLAEREEDDERRTDEQRADLAKVYSYNLSLLKKVFLWWKPSISEYYNHQEASSSCRKDGKNFDTFDSHFKENMGTYWKNPPSNFRELYMSSLKLTSNERSMSKGKSKFGMPVVLQQGQRIVFGWNSAEQLWNQLISAWCAYHDNIILSALNIIEDHHEEESLRALLSNAGKHADIPQYLRIMKKGHGQFAPALAQKLNQERTAKQLQAFIKKLSTGVPPLPDDTSLDLNPVQ